MAIGPFLLAAIGGQGGVKVPGAPGTLSLSNGSTSGTMIDLSWSAPSDTGGGTVSGYRIKKDGSTLVADTGSTGTTYTATGLTRLTEYNFNVAAINEKGTGADGNTPAHTTTAEVPGAPGTLSLSAGSPSTTAINLSWSAPSDTGGATVTGYRIKKNGSTLVADTGSTGTTYSATGLTQNTSYNFTVAAINSIGTGADGNTPSLSTAAAPMVATGGDSVTTQGIYTVHTFNNSGVFTVTSNPNSRVANVLLVGGGGSDGEEPSGTNYSNGGAGGGGVRTTTITTTQTVTVGAGGANAGNDGGTTTCSISVGGGGASNVAGSTADDAPSDGGGSQGGSQRYWLSMSTQAAGSSGTYGYDGGAPGNQSSPFETCGGGGGGAGHAGYDATPGTTPTGGDGGEGVENDYQTGSNQYYGGGGGGAACKTGGSGISTRGEGGNGGGGYGGFTYGNGSFGNALAGVSNTGGGGGGRGYGNSTGNRPGGSGVVIIRYVT